MRVMLRGPAVLTLCCAVGVGLATAAPITAGADCVMGDCGTGRLVPAAATVGSTVRVEVDNGYFTMWTPDEWASWCGSLGIVLGGELPPIDDPVAPLTVEDAGSATFRVPEMPPGEYVALFSCGNDQAFGQPELPDSFTVLAGPATDTAAPVTEPVGLGTDPADPSPYLAVLAMAGAAGAVVWGLRGRSRRPPAD